jgi:hypothetical protein
MGGRTAAGGGMWARLRTWPGKLTENIVQAVARDVMADALVAMDGRGVPLVATIHDELVAEVPETKGLHHAGLDALGDAQRPSWAGPAGGRRRLGRVQIQEGLKAMDTAVAEQIVAVEYILKDRFPDCAVLLLVQTPGTDYFTLSSNLTNDESAAVLAMMALQLKATSALESGIPSPLNRRERRAQGKKLD